MLKLILKIQNWYWATIVKYQELKSRNTQIHKCDHCGKRYTFDVPVDVPLEYIEFVCEKCVKLEKNNING